MWAFSMWTGRYRGRRSIMCAIYACLFQLKVCHRWPINGRLSLLPSGFPSTKLKTRCTPYLTLHLHEAKIWIRTHWARWKSIWLFENIKYAGSCLIYRTLPVLELMKCLRIWEESLVNAIKVMAQFYPIAQYFLVFFYFWNVFTIS